MLLEVFAHGKVVYTYFYKKGNNDKAKEQNKD